MRRSGRESHAISDGPDVRRAHHTQALVDPHASARVARQLQLCCVDDAQWLDALSAEALVFAARRFEAEPIAVLLAVREGELRRIDAPGLPALELHGLDQDESRTLLRARLDSETSADVLEPLRRRAPPRAR